MRPVEKGETSGEKRRDIWREEETSGDWRKDIQREKRHLESKDTFGE